jgi:hypothetical protein
LEKRSWIEDLQTRSLRPQALSIGVVLVGQVEQIAISRYQKFSFN